MNRGLKYGLVVKETDCFESFWNEILLPNLAEKHHQKPVHSVEEITNLKLKFPKTLDNSMFIMKINWLQELQF